MSGFWSVKTAFSLSPYIYELKVEKRGQNRYMWGWRTLAG